MSPKPPTAEAAKIPYVADIEGFATPKNILRIR
jgi:hypothetical protein